MTEVHRKHLRAVHREAFEAVLTTNGSHLLDDPSRLELSHRFECLASDILSVDEQGRLAW